MTGQLERVGVNLTWMTPDVVGGSEDATVQLLDAILDRDESPALVVFAQAPFVDAHPDLAARCEVELVDGASARPRRVWLEHTWLASTAARKSLDLMHHAGGTMPLRGPRPATLTIHDLQPLEIPSNFDWQKRIYLRTILRAASRAERILVPSSFVRSTVIDHLAVDPSTVEVTGWPVRPSHGAPSARKIRTVRAKYGIGTRYWVWPAVTYPHKNHDVLIRAFSSRRLAEIELVLPGAAGPAEEAVSGLIGALGLGDRVHRIGRIPRDELDALVSGSIGIAVPSDYEGFGLPILDAAAANVAAVASRSGSLPEVAGALVPLVPRGDLEGWVDAIERISHDTDHRQAIIDGGAEVLHRFEPSVVAGRVLKVWSAATGLSLATS